MRTSNLVFFNPHTDMPATRYDSATGNLNTAGTGNRALGTKAPGAAGGPAINDRTAMHGIMSESNVASLLVDTAATISVYFWNKVWGEWVKGGAAAADYQKAVEARGQWSFTGQEGTPFYLVADVVVVRATLYASQVRL